MATIPRDSTDEEQAAFERICDQLSGFDERLQAEWLDGYLTALHAGPVTIPKETWFGRLFGDAFDRAFADPPSAAEAHAVIDARCRVIASQLDPEWLIDHDPEPFLSPMIWSITDEERAALVAAGTVSAEDDASWAGTGEEWAHGFMDALETLGEEWSLVKVDEADSQAFDELLGVVVALTYDRGSPELDEHLKESYADEVPTRDEMVADALVAVQEIRVFWLDHAPVPAQRTVATSPGRNDKCPCGSGLKYKKCHGATVAE